MTNEMDYEIYLTFRDYSSRLTRRGYVTAHGGNMSMRSGDTVWITRHASSLESLRPEDVVKVYLSKPSGHDLIASTEKTVHFKIYQETPNLAIVHAHPPYSVALSFFVEKLIPPDEEGYHVLKEIPVVEGSPGSPLLAEHVADALKKHYAVIVRGHGVFAASKFIDVAYQFLCMVEHSAKIKYLTMILSQTGAKYITPEVL